MIQTTTRNAGLDDLASLLREQHARKVDVVAPATSIRARDGLIQVKGAEQQITLDGVTTVDGRYTPTKVADAGLADRLGIPVAYLRRMREERPDLYDENVNGWLHGRKAKVRTITTQTPAGVVYGSETLREGLPADPRSFLLRAFSGDDGEAGVLRAVLSDRYAITDNLDVLLAALAGVRESGVPIEVRGADLTDTRMVVRVHSPAVQAMAPTLLAGYRSPFSGASGTDNPTVFAGFKITNSEVGGGAFQIVPEVVVQVCTNGMTMTVDALREVHVGGRMEAGVIRWAEDTQEKNLALITARTRDAVTGFLSPEYLTGAVTRLERKAGEEVTNHDAVRTLAKGLRFTDEQADGILGYFTRGGQMTMGGVVNAITAYSQVVADGDEAYGMEARATRLLGV